ncbi:hypothetical protein J7M28_07840, partial [bacterium]|nr:hypothetical protein [bacterium]
GYPEGPESWEQVAEPDFGEEENQHIDSTAVFDGKLYMGVCNTEGCQVWCTDGSESASPPLLSWTKVAEHGFGSGHDEGSEFEFDNSNAYSMAVYDGYLYVGTLNTYSGCEVWRSNSPGLGSWERVNYGGFGKFNETEQEWEDEEDNICVMDMIVYRGDLYAGTYNYWAGSEADWSAGRVFRYAPAQDDPKLWEQVWDGKVGENGSGEPLYALAARCFAQMGDSLYVGVFHNSGDDIFRSLDGDNYQGLCNIDGVASSDVVDLIVFNDTRGATPHQRLYATTGQGALDNVWRSEDGLSWEKRSEDDFGDSTNTSFFCMGTYAVEHEFNELLIGTWKDEDTGNTGTEVWRTPTDDTTAISLESFAAVPQKNGSILLRWETGTEIGTAGFFLLRSEIPDMTTFKRVNSKIISGAGTPHSGAIYELVDRRVNSGTLYYYFLVEVDVLGETTMFGPVQVRPLIRERALCQTYSAILEMDTFGV